MSAYLIMKELSGKKKKIITFTIMWAVCIASLVIGILTYPKKETRISKEECTIVNGIITDISVEKVKTSLYMYDNKYVVTYSYAGKNYRVVYWNAFTGAVGENRQICIYGDVAYASYEALEHNERIKATSRVSRITLGFFYGILVLGGPLCYVAFRKTRD